VTPTTEPDSIHFLQFHDFEVVSHIAGGVMPDLWILVRKPHQK
jgi:hypothetical protein